MSLSIIDKQQIVPYSENYQLGIERVLSDW